MKASPLPSDAEPQVSKANMLNKQEVAQKLGVSVRTLDNLVTAREFPPRARVGRFLYWTALQSAPSCSRTGSRRLACTGLVQSDSACGVIWSRLLASKSRTWL